MFRKILRYIGFPFKSGLSAILVKPIKFLDVFFKFNLLILLFFNLIILDTIIKSIPNS
jgi:hypothetical protein